jgi:hypothetical protein
VTTLHSATADKINATPEDCRQLAGHPNVVEQAPFGVGQERDQEIDVAVGSEVLTQHRPEELQAANLPAGDEHERECSRATTIAAAGRAASDDLDTLTVAAR